MPRLTKKEKPKTKTKKDVEKQEPIEQVDTTPKAKPRKRNSEDDMTIIDYIKQEFFKSNPDADENGTGGAFFKADLSDVDYDDQNDYFNIMKGMFTSLNINKPKMQLEDFVDSYYDLLEMATEMAVCGCVPAMDYLCFIYKKGIDDVMPINLTRAHEWGLLATAAGSKLSPERLRMFMDPVYRYVIDNDAVESIIQKHDIQSDEDLVNFIAYSFANIFNEKQKLNLGYMSKKSLISDESFQVFLKNTSKVRDEALPVMLKFIA